jgi:dienelactone hydrolase
VKRSTFSALSLSGLVLTIAIAGCGGGGGETQLPVAVSVTVSPFTVQAGATAQVTAIVTNDPAGKGVIWAVSCSVAPCGTVSPSSTASGVATTYTAPASAPASDLAVTITATSVASSSASASAAVTVPGATPTVLITPVPNTVAAGTTVQFTATVTNDPANKGVTWAVQCSGADCGTISPTATASGAATTYTAPAAIPTGNLDVLVTATSVSEPSVVGGVPFAVPGTSVSIDMVSATDLDAGGTAQLSATVANDPSNQGVTWTVSCSPAPCGSVSPTATKDGIVTTYTAPSTPPDSDLAVTITATSVFNTGAQSTAGVTVHTVTVSVTPGSVLLPINVTQDFTATVAHDPASKGVTWTAAQNGAVCSPGCGTAAPSNTASGSPTTYTPPAALPANPAVSLDATSVESAAAAAVASVSLTTGSVKLVPNSLNFGAVTTGGTSAAKTVALTNTGTGSLTITGITTSATFTQTNDCGASVGAGASCTVSVTFRPTRTGTVSGDLAISDSSTDSPQHVGLSGTGFQLCHVQIRKTLQSSAVRTALATYGTAAAPSPTGPSNVGTRTMRLVDSNRDDPFQGDGAKREVMVRFWYPASLTQVCKPAEYTPPAVWSYFSQLMELPLPTVTTNSCLNASIAEGAHPVVVFTHGYTGTFTDYTFLFEDLASRGYVVASVDHTYEATAVEFPDGRFVHSGFGSHLGKTMLEDEQALSFALVVRLDDLRFVVNELMRLNATVRSPFAGKLDTSRIAIAGHSMGGLAAALGVEREPRFKAGVIIDVHDGAVPDAVVKSTQRPVLILASGRKQWTENECKLWSSLRGPRFAVNLEGAEHLTTSDAVWLAKDTIKTGTMGPDKAVRAVRDYIAAFLDANLQGKTLEPLLSGPSSDYADAMVTTQTQALCKEAAKDR